MVAHFFKQAISEGMKIPQVKRTWRTFNTNVTTSALVLSRINQLISKRHLSTRITNNKCECSYSLRLNQSLLDSKTLKPTVNLIGICLNFKNKTLEIKSDPSQERVMLAMFRSNQRRCSVKRNQLFWSTGETAKKIEPVDRQNKNMIWFLGSVFLLKSNIFTTQYITNTEE